jgi:hypothetical protein
VLASIRTGHSICSERMRKITKDCNQNSPYWARFRHSEHGAVLNQLVLCVTVSLQNHEPHRANVMCAGLERSGPWLSFIACGFLIYL